MISSYCFCLDRELNILITDYSADTVMIFSNRGQLLHKLGNRSEGRGNFVYPTGIATDREDRV